MIGGHGRIGDAMVYTLSCQDRIVLDENANLDVNNIKALTIYCSDICARSPTMPIFVSSNITFGEDVAFQKDLFIEGNLIAGSSGTLDITGNLVLTNKLSIIGGLSVGADALIKGNLTVNDKLCAVNLITAKNGLDVVGDMNVDGGMTVVQDVLFEGNVTGGNLNISGNLDVNGNLTVQDLYVHTIHGFSPVNFNDIASFGKGANFKQLVKLLAADLQATLGSKIRIRDGPSGGALECEDAAPIMMDKGLFHNVGGNMMVTKIPSVPSGGNFMLDGGGDHMVMGGNIQVMEQGGGGGSIVVMGGNINVTGHNVTGRGSISVLDGGDINLRNGGSLVVNDGGNVVIENGGNIILGGGGTIVIMGMTAEALTFPIPEIQGGTKQISYATGDTLYASATDTLSKLPIGTAGDVLTVNGLGVPMWTSIPSGPGGTVTSVTAGSGLDVGAGPGGSITGSGTLNIAPLGVTNAMLAGSITNAKLINSSVTVTAGTGLSGGGAVALGATTTLSLSTTPSVTNLTITGPVNNSMFAATKQYVDAAVSALNVHEPVFVATTTATTLNSGGMPPTYLNGVMGVGATLTAFAINTALIVDGYTFIASDVTNATRILVKDQGNQQHNGIYTFSQLQTAGLPWIITRATDADNSPTGELKNGDFNFVQSGTANASTGWVEICVGTGPGDEIIIGTDNICYAQISGAGTYSAGAGLNLAGTIFSVATGGVTNAMLQNSSVTVTAGTGLTGGGAVSLGGTTTLNIGTVPVANGGTNITSYAVGDVLYATTPTTLTKLPIGASLSVLSTMSGAPAWSLPTFNIFATPTIYSTGGVFLFNTDTRVPYYRVNMWAGGGGGYSIAGGLGGTGGAGGGFVSFVFRNINTSTGVGISQVVTITVGGGGANVFMGPMVGSAGNGANSAVTISGVSGSVVVGGGTGGTATTAAFKPGGTLLSATLANAFGYVAANGGSIQAFSSNVTAGAGAGGMVASGISMAGVTGEDGSALPLSMGMTLIGGQGGGNVVGDAIPGRYYVGIGGNGGKTAFYASPGGNPGGGGGGSFQYSALGAAGAVILIPLSAYSSAV
jgi:hypothetical protein